MALGLQRSKSKQRTAALEHEQLTSLIGSMADGVIAIDGKSKVVQYNGAALSLLDVNGTMTGQSLEAMLNLYDKDGKPVNVQRLISDTTIPITSRDYLLHYSDGSKANLYVSIAPVHLGYGTEGDRGYVLLLRDITREKSLEEERDEFISVVSHELRTPLAIAEGNISNAQFIANRSGDIQETKKALVAAYDQILFLAALVNDLSTLSRAERGVLEITSDPIDPGALVKELADGYRGQATTKKLKLLAEVGENLPTLHSSKLYVREILHNFITNAIKYTNSGTVTISAHVDGLGVHFAVHDTGIGISRADQKKLFEKFFRSEDYRTRANNGTGLGLYVTLKLARLLHADIDVQSQLNHGSTFSLTVPNLSATEMPTAKHSTKPSTSDSVRSSS